ncbi:unnamed protein product, partial [Mesorhabditis belari]|uniref:Bystin n=1 Tax=Mesorhabditis belari TaxID=2138241 RepID=A0AAF3J1V3_9BILA
MGKFKKALKNRGFELEKLKNERPNLETQDAGYRADTHEKVNRKRISEESTTKFIGDKAAARIFSQARKQLAEDDEVADNDEPQKRLRHVSLGDVITAEDEELNFEDYDETQVEVDPDEEADFKMFMAEGKQQQSLWEMIQDKIEQKKVDVDCQLDMPDGIEIRDLDPQVIEMYREVGMVLSKYRAGKLPKAFKYTASMENWEQLLYLTEPDAWSAASMYQATVLFSSNLNPVACQRFYHHVLLPRLRDDIDEYKKLNYPLYQSLVKSLYKPAAFFKGLVMPLCESGTCTLREAVIFCSVIQKFSIPIFHAAAGLLMIAEMDYSGANSLFIRTLIDKKYALPLRVIKALVDHFKRFKDETRELPVLWHQALLSFIQRYKLDLTEQQKKDIFELVKVHFHYLITPEIRRELQHATKTEAEQAEHTETSVGVAGEASSGMIRVGAYCFSLPSTARNFLSSTQILSSQVRGRRRTLTAPPWAPLVYETFDDSKISDANKQLVNKIYGLEREQALNNIDEQLESISARKMENPSYMDTRRVGLVATKIGMLPQWTNTGKRILCTLLHVNQNNVVKVKSPEDWYRTSIIGRRKAFGRAGPMWQVTVGASDGEPWRFHRAYRKMFAKAGLPVKEKIASFIVTPDAVPQLGMPLDVRHFTVGQYITASGKTIDWGFQGAMHRWGFRGQPQRRTTKSHRRIGSIGSVGDARVWPSKRMPGHMGYEWSTTSGLKVIRMNIDKQVIYIKGNVPGDIGETVLLKDCLQAEKYPKALSIPTWTPSLATIPEASEEVSSEEAPFTYQQEFLPELFKFTSPTIVFTEVDGKKAAGRDKTKAKIAKVKK